MTFLENLEPLLWAAEQYAGLTYRREHYQKDLGTFGDLVIEQNEAAQALLAAAIEFAKWSKINDPIS
jgi:hypothetical protein